MPQLSHFKSAPPEAVRMQIVQLAGMNTTELSLTNIQPDNQLFSLYRLMLGIEVATYLNSIGAPDHLPTELLVAFDDANPLMVVGFLLYMPLDGRPEAAGVLYMAVENAFRGRGIGSALVEGFLGRRPDAGLTCFPDKVRFYEALGFEVVGVHATQLKMSTRRDSSGGQMRTLDQNEIARAPAVRKLAAKIVQAAGQSGYDAAEEALVSHVERLCIQARAAYQASLSRVPKPAG